MKKFDEKSFMKSDGDPYYSWCFSINYPSVTSPSSFIHVQKEKKSNGLSSYAEYVQIRAVSVAAVFYFLFFVKFELIHTTCNTLD